VRVVCSIATAFVATTVTTAAVAGYEKND